MFATRSVSFKELHMSFYGSKHYLPEKLCEIVAPYRKTETVDQIWPRTRPKKTAAAAFRRGNRPCRWRRAGRRRGPAATASTSNPRARKSTCPAIGGDCRRRAKPTHTGLDPAGQQYASDFGGRYSGQRCAFLATASAISGISSSGKSWPMPSRTSSSAPGIEFLMSSPPGSGIRGSSRP